MALDYVNLRDNVATRLITENGRSLTLRRTSRKPADTAKPWASSATGDTSAADVDTEQAITTIGVFLDTEVNEDQGAGEAGTGGASSVLKRTARLLLSADPLLPEEVGSDWYVDDGTQRWEITDIKAVRPGAVLIYYDAEVAL